MKNNLPEVYVIGLGYVGLTLAVAMADAGLNVFGIDKSPEIINSLKSGTSHFFEEELDVKVKKVINNGLKVSCKLERSPNPAAFIISVGTPVDPETKKPLLTQIDQTIDNLAPTLKAGDLVILRSTVPVGTSTTHVLKRFVEKSGLKPGKDLFFAFAPERTVEGKAMFELRSLPQIIGGYDEKSTQMAAQLFQTYNKDIVLMPNIEHAEMLKVIDNSYRDVLFSYANQMALICEHMDLNYSLIRDVANHNYPRNNIPMSSPGVGGACLTKDPYLLIDICKKNAVNHQLISAGRELNEYISVYLANQLLSELQLNKINPEKAKIFILGLAFKGQPPTSDIRFSPTLDFFEALRDKIPQIYGYDPHVKSDVIRATGISPCQLEEGFKDTNAVVVMTNHSSWKSINIYDFKDEVGQPCTVFDHWDIIHNKKPDDPTFRFKGFGLTNLFPGYPINLKDESQNKS